MVFICPMFGNGVMGQNVKRSLTFALFLVKMTLIIVSDTCIRDRNFALSKYFMGTSIVKGKKKEQWRI